MDQYLGKFDSPEDWAEDWLTSTGELSLVPGHLQSYIDYKAFAHDCLIGGDICFTNGGYVFSSY